MTDRIAMKKVLDPTMYGVVPTVTSLLQVSPTSWQVRWTEEQRGLGGMLLALP